MDSFDVEMNAEILGITSQGLRLYVGGEVLFLSYSDFPWFRKAPVEAVFNVQPLGVESLTWPDLDIDLSIDSIRRPDSYPLVARH